MLFTGKLDRVSLQQSFFLKNSWERRYTERQNLRHGPPGNCTKIQVRVAQKANNGRTKAAIVTKL